MNQELHLVRALDALDVAQKLKQDHPAWALVPLFYSALHLMHARFDADRIPDDDMRHPELHKSHRKGPYGDVVKWGTLDVVRDLYPEVSPAYHRLYAVSRSTRYKIPPKPGECAPFWDTYRWLSEKVWPS